MGSYAAEWDGENGRQYRFFADMDEAQNFAADRDGVLTRRTNLEDVFIELTGKAMK